MADSFNEIFKNLFFNPPLTAKCQKQEADSNFARYV